MMAGRDGIEPPRSKTSRLQRGEPTNAQPAEKMCVEGPPPDRRPYTDCPSPEPPNLIGGCGASAWRTAGGRLVAGARFERAFRGYEPRPGPGYRSGHPAKCARAANSLGGAGALVRFSIRGCPCATRTRDPDLRTIVLYSTELRGKVSLARLRSAGRATGAPRAA